MMKECPFCKIANKVFENNLAQAFYDDYPVTKGHLLIIPKRHEADYFNLSGDERRAIHELVELGKSKLDMEEKPDAYNIGINIGEAAGQTVFHCHVHLIPRYFGDVENPVGGVRGVIPEKQNYR